MKNILYLLLFLLFQFSIAQELTIRKGVVVDSLAVNDSIPETYAIYLPQDFTMDKTWPAIFVFDAEGKARSAVQLFRIAAEEQGYIIISSNNVDENNPLIENIRTASRLINKVLFYFPVDRNGVYTAGFGQGAVVATALTSIYDKVEGVVSIGDTWLNSSITGKNSDFVFIGLAGASDFRRYLIEETVGSLKKAGNKATLSIYEGGHVWPSPEIISSAAGELTLKAMAKGNRAKDPAFVEELYQKDLEIAEQLKRRLLYYKAYQWLEQLKSKYVLYDKKDDLKQRQKEIRKEQMFKQQRRRYNRASAMEAEYKAQYDYFLQEDILASNFENLGWWNQQIKELKKIQTGDNIAEQEMAYRLQGYLQAYAKNTFEELERLQAAIDPLIFTAILRTIFDPENPEGYFSIISLSAQDGDYYTALLYLEDLLKTGYKNMEALYDIPGTLDLKLSPEYNETIKKYLGDSKFYDR